MICFWAVSGPHEHMMFHPQLPLQKMPGSSSLFCPDWHTPAYISVAINVTIPLSRPQQHRSFLVQPAANLDGGLFFQTVQTQPMGFFKPKMSPATKKDWFYNKKSMKKPFSNILCQTEIWRCANGTVLTMITLAFHAGIWFCSSVVE